MFEDRRQIRIAGSLARLAIIFRKSDCFIGAIGSYAIDEQRIGLTYWISGDYQRRGLGSEALRAYCLPALNAFGAQFIVANIARQNTASLAAVRAVGFLPSRFSDDPGFGTVDGRILLEIDHESAAKFGAACH